MAGLNFDDLIPQPTQRRSQPGGGLVFDDLIPAQQAVPAAPGPSRPLNNMERLVADAPVRVEREMPNMLDALTSGVRSGFGGIEQTAETIGGGGAPQVHQGGPEAAPITWGDFTSPQTLLPKAAYSLGHSAPMLAGGIAGGVAGAATPVPGGALIGGGVGAGVMAAAQSLGPYYAQALKQNPNDPDAAFDLALKQAGTEGAVGGLMWGAFAVKPFAGAVKNLLFQGFAAQPAVAEAGQAVQATIAGESATSRFGQATPGAIVGGAVPLAGHAAVRGVSRMLPQRSARPEPVPAEAPTRSEIDPVARPDLNFDDLVPVAADARQAPDVNLIGDLAEGKRPLPSAEELSLAVRSVRAADDHALGMQGWSKEEIARLEQLNREIDRGSDEAIAEKRALLDRHPESSPQGMEFADPGELGQLATEFRNLERHGAETVEQYADGIARVLKRYVADVTSGDPFAKAVFRKAFSEAQSAGLSTQKLSDEIFGRFLGDLSPGDQAFMRQQFAAFGLDHAPRRQIEQGQGVPLPARSATEPHRVSVAGMEPVEVAPRVVEASELLTSSDPGYDAKLQPRQRDRAAAEQQVRDIATNLEPERLGHSTEADRGAPIIGPDRMVESGNGRVLALRHAYQQGGEQAQRYRQWLASQGVDVSKYREPVLVRERVTELSAGRRQMFAVAANRPATLSMSAPERALADSSLIRADTLELIRNPDDLGAAANRDFVRAFVRALPQSEQGALTNAEGGLSAEGLTRVRNAVLAKAYGDAHVLTRIAEATTDDIKSISNALTSAAPVWARLRAGIEAGAVRPDMDLTPALMQAATRAADLRSKGVKLDTFLAQADAFDRLPGPVESFLRMFYDPTGRRDASAGKIADGLKFYAEEAAKVQAEAGLDLGLAPVDAGAVQRRALERTLGQNAETESLFFGGGAGDGPGGATGGRLAQRPVIEQSRGGPGEPGVGRDQLGQAGIGAELAAVRPARAEAGLDFSDLVPPRGPGGRPPGGGGGDGAGGEVPRSPSERAILARIAPEASSRRVPTLNEVYTRAKDDLNPLRVVTKQLADGQPVPVESNPYLLARLSRGSFGKADQFLEYGTFDFNSLRTTGKSLRDILRPVEKDLDGFRAFAVARRALELKGRDIETGIPLDAARSVVNAGLQKYEQIFTQLQDYQKSLLDYLKDAGILSDDAYSAMRAANRDYVPFYRLLEDSELTGRTPGLRVRNPVKTIEGSRRQIIDPIESVIKNTYVFVALAEHNRVMNALVELANKSPRGAELLRQKKEQAVRVPDGELADFLESHDIRSGAESFSIFRPQSFRPSSGEIARYNKGTREVYRVDEELANAVGSLDRQSASLLIRALAVPARTLRAGAVLSPDFIARNIVRDQFTAFAFSKSGYIPVYDTLRGLGSLLRKDGDYQMWLKAGGANSALVAIDRNYVAQSVFHLTDGPLAAMRGVIRSPLEMLRVASEVTENATRLGEFKRALGKSDDPAKILEAGFRSREVTLDFARLGSEARAVNMIVAFFNAQVEGIDRAARAFIDRPLATTAKIAASITLPSVLLWFSNHQDPRWKEIPQWQKDLFWIVMTDDQIYRIPKPFELGVIFGSLPERVLEAYFADNEDAYKEFMKSMVDAFLPSFIPQALVPPVEQFANWSTFLDRPIVPRSVERIEPQYQTTDYTTESAKLLGRVIAGIPGMEDSQLSSPITVENYVRGWTGTLGTYALQAADQLLEAAGVTERKVKPTATMADMPLFKAFAVRYPSSGAQSIGDFYEEYSDLNKRAATFRALEKGGAAEQAASYAERHGVVKVPGSIRSVADALSNQRKFIQSINRNPDMNPDDKRKLIDQTYLQMIEVARAGNRALETMRTKQ